MSADPSPKETPVRRGERLVLYALCLALLGVLGLLWLTQKGFFGAVPVVEHGSEKRLDKPIEMNSAKWYELAELPGIGEQRAKEIVDWREYKFRHTKQGIGRLEELLDNVPGITPAIIDQIRDLVRIEPRKKAAR